MNIQEKIFELADEQYKQFQAKLMPNVPPEIIVGVRVPLLRKLAKEIYKDGHFNDFLNTLPHKFYDENNLHGFILCEIKDFDQCICEINRFLPFVDNWATCDLLSPKVFKKNTEKLLPHIDRWISSNETYTIRFGIEMLMSFYLDDLFSDEFLEKVCKIKSDEYYVNMMIAWFFSTALVKQYDRTIVYIEKNRLDTWVHNKTIQKALESYRISDCQKEYLRSLKIKECKN